MFTVALKKDPLALFRRYIRENYQFFKELTGEETEDALFPLIKAKGFDNTVQFADNIFCLPFHEFLREMKSIILQLQPPRFFRKSSRWDAVCRLAMEDVIWGHDIFEFKKTLGATEPEQLNLLEIETASGEGIQSAIIKLKPLLSSVIKFNAVALESDDNLLSKALQNSYSEEQLQDVDPDLREMNFKSFGGDTFTASNEFSHSVKFFRLDVLNEDLSAINDQKYNIILADNLADLYPASIVTRIIEKLLPHLKLEGIIVIDFGEGDFPAIEGLDVVEEYGYRFYRRNRKLYSSKIDIHLENAHQSTASIVDSVNYLVGKRRFEEALVRMEEITQKNRKSPVLHHLQGDINLLKSEYHDALKCYQRALILDKTFLPSFFNTVILSLIEGSQEKAFNDGERLLQITNTADFPPGAFGGLFNTDTESIVNFCRRLSDCLKDQDSLALESLVLDVMKAQGNENIIPLQTGVFKSLIVKQLHHPSITPTKMEAEAKITFLDSYSQADISRLMNKSRESRPQKETQVSPGETPRIPAMPAGVKSDTTGGEFYSSSLSRSFLKNIEQLMDHEDFGQIINYLNKKSINADEIQRDVSRIIARLSISAKKLQMIKNEMSKTIRHLNELMEE